ncbi:Fur family transcriptional regulator, iron response regulator [Pleomorphomonas diazotrophica]|nr:Fur family transcriptional regulator, iron response regulator [Pleomorphomonas diazotrophica]
MDRPLPSSPSTAATDMARRIAPGAASVSGASMMTKIPVRTRLRDVGLRPTRQRVALAEILFSHGHRHLSAEDLHAEAVTAKVPVSLATVYNTLNQFTEAGLLREVAVEGTRTYFDTNTDDHHHFYVEDENRVFDIPGPHVEIGDLPPAPEGMEIVRVDVVVRLRNKR